MRALGIFILLALLACTGARAQQPAAASGWQGKYYLLLDKCGTWRRQVSWGSATHCNQLRARDTLVLRFTFRPFTSDSLYRRYQQLGVTVFTGQSYQGCTCTADSIRILTGKYSQPQHLWSYPAGPVRTEPGPYGPDYLLLLPAQQVYSLRSWAGQQTFFLRPGGVRMNCAAFKGKTIVPYEPDLERQMAFIFDK